MRIGVPHAWTAPTPDGLRGDLTGYVEADTRRRKVRQSDACPGSGRLFADTIAARPVTPRPKKPEPPAGPPPTLF
jgi:hypothetical protein